MVPGQGNSRRRVIVLLVHHLLGWLVAPLKRREREIGIEIPAERTDGENIGEMTDKETSSGPGIAAEAVLMGVECEKVSLLWASVDSSVRVVSSTGTEEREGSIPNERKVGVRLGEMVDTEASSSVGRAV